MALVPVGTKRLMIAQSYAGGDFGADFGEDPKAQEIASETGAAPAGDVAPDELGAGDPATEEPQVGEEIRPEARDEDQTGQPADNIVQGEGMDEKMPAKDVQGYIFNKLQEFGYPPRRLEEFEDEFVEETLSPGDVRDVTIVIPARYYGKRETLSKKDFAGVVNDIQSKYGLSFVSAKKQGKKITIQFTSQVAQQMDQGMADDLDQVYGTPKGSKAGGGGQKKAAFTQGEMMKSAKEKLYLDLIRRANGGA